MDDRDAAAVVWLLASDEPAVRFLTRRDVLGEDAPHDRELIPAGPKVRQLLAGQQPDGGFGVHPYSKWTGAHWRLLSLVELAVPAGHPQACAAASTVLDWLASRDHRDQIPTVDGRPRMHASMEGNALAVACRLGMADDPRARVLVDSLVACQWPDGGWNCDPRSAGERSSFHESLPPMWGLHEYAVATGDAATAAAARRTAALLLSHRLYRSLRTGKPIHPSWTALHHPPYWHYDVLQALLIISRMGLAADPRTADAFAVLARRRLRDGRWRTGGAWWHRPGTAPSRTDVVDWGRGGPNEMVTLNALRCLRAAGRLGGAVDDMEPVPEPGPGSAPGSGAC